MDDSHRDLVRTARDALRALLTQTEPGEGLALHQAYTELGRMLESEGEGRHRPVLDARRHAQLRAAVHGGEPEGAHPTESARAALWAAAAVETGDWPFLLDRFARLLPRREDRLTAPTTRRAPHAPAPWKGFPLHVRERQVLEAVGDERCATADVLNTLRRAEPDLRFYSDEVSSVLNRLFKARELDREAETWRNRKRYRYFRRVSLEGPIADLERSLEIS